MIINTKMYIIGTKDRPTNFLTFTDEYTEDIGEAMFYVDKKLAEEHMNCCDNLNYTVYTKRMFISTAYNDRSVLIWMIILAGHMPLVE